jgi:hypothetical protein
MQASIPHIATIFFAREEQCCIFCACKDDYGTKMCQAHCFFNEYGSRDVELIVGLSLTYSGGQGLRRPADMSAIPVGRSERADILHQQPLRR